MFNESEIRKLEEQFGFKCEVKFDTLFIKSRFHHWKVEKIDSLKPHFKLFHENRPGSTSGYHVQGKKNHRTKSQHATSTGRQFYDLPYIFKSINNHDNNQFHKKSKCVRMDIIFKELKLYG